MRKFLAAWGLYVGGALTVLLAAYVYARRHGYVFPPGGDADELER